jgi:hypothetical protein
MAGVENLPRDQQPGRLSIITMPWHAAWPTRRSGSIGFMATPPESTKISLGQRLRERARDRWPALAEVTVRHRSGFAYIDGHLPDGTVLRLCRLRYGGYANQWGFAIWLPSKNGYQDSVLPNGQPVGTAEQALDCACGLYLDDPTAWLPE